MSFDGIAPHYGWLEAVTAGALLQRCRTAFIAEVADARNILLLGEGRGRFLVELMRLNSAARITCVDASIRMIECMRDTVRRDHLPVERVTFLHADLLVTTLGVHPEAGSFDAVASHFLLDCFPPHPLQQVVSAVGRCVAPGARWLVSDFCVPDGGWQRVRARMVLAVLYAFFRMVTRLPARRLTPPDDALRGAGFQLKQRRLFNGQLLHSDVWQQIRIVGTAGGSPPAGAATAWRS